MQDIHHHSSRVSVYVFSGSVGPRPKATPKKTPSGCENGKMGWSQLPSSEAPKNAKEPKRHQAFRRFRSFFRAFLSRWEVKKTKNPTVGGGKKWFRDEITVRFVSWVSHNLRMIT